MAFGDCQTPPPVPLTPDEICQGFAKCGEPGMRLNPTNLTRIIAYLEALLGVDIDALATQLCANEIFQQCVIDLTSSSTHTVESVVALPDSAPEGSEFCITVTIDTPVVGTPLSIPIALLPVDEQLIHDYVIPPFLVIAVGDTEGFVCVTTTNDVIDEPDMSLVFALSPTPRLPGWPGGNYAVTVTDNDAPIITPPISTSDEGEEGDPLDITYGTFTATIGTPTLVATGLPGGVTFTDNGDGTYTLEGAYPPPPGGEVDITITASAPGASDVAITHTLVTIAFPALNPALNPADVDSNIALSNANRTAHKAIGINWRSGRSITGHNAGQWYYEWTPDEFSGSFVGAGFATAAMNLVGYTGADPHGLGIVTDGSLFRNAVSVPSGVGAMTEGDVVGMALDIDTGEFWVRVNGGDWNGNPAHDPETNVGGFTLDPAMITGTPDIFVAVMVQVSPDDQVTVNTGQAAFADAPPTGYLAWG